MNIQTNLPHERKGGESLALFGAPRHEFKDGQPIIYVDCHILLVKDKDFFPSWTLPMHEGEDEGVSEGTHFVMYKHARKLARAYAKTKKWSIIKNDCQYFKEDTWRGFMFMCNKKK